MTSSATMILSETPRALRQILAADETPPNYSCIYRLVIDGRIPATRRGKCWEIRAADLPQIAQALGLRIAANI